MKKIIRICYIDDRIDPTLSRYLDEFCERSNEKGELGSYNLEFLEYTFQDTDNYKTLLNNEIINKSNILVIDSRLFENERSSLSKFTGEQFKIILRQVLPFIKTVVISQNSMGQESLTILKFQSVKSNNKSSKEHYDENLKPVLERHILSTIEEYNILNQLSQEDEVDSILLSTIQSTIMGIRDTALFEKEDLDKLIELFKEVKTKYGD